MWGLILVVLLIILGGGLILGVMGAIAQGLENYFRRQNSHIVGWKTISSTKERNDYFLDKAKRGKK